MKSRFWSKKNWIANIVIEQKKKIRKFKEELNLLEQKLPENIKESKELLLEKAKKELVGKRVWIKQTSYSGGDKVPFSVDRVSETEDKDWMFLIHGGYLTEGEEVVIGIEWSAKIEIVE